MARLGDICTVVSGSTPKSNIPEYWDGDIKWITPAELTEQSYIITDSARHITELGVQKTGLKPFPAGTVILSSRAPIGKTAIAGCEMFCNQGFKNLICSDQVNNRYLYWFLTCNTDYLNSLGRGATFKEISKGIVEDIEIPLPSISKQVEIAEKFEKVSDLIALRKEQLAKLDQLVNSRFVELFGHKGYPEDSLLNLCNVIDYRGKTPEKVENGLPFITAKNVRMHQMNLEPREYISKETYDKVMVRGFPKEGDVVFTTEAPLGNVCRIPHFDTEFYIGQRIVTLQTEKLEPIYLEYALSSDDFKTKYMGKSSGSTVTGIRVRLLEQLTIPVPPMELQEQFATFVEQTQKSKLAIQQSLDKLELLKKSLMQEYFGQFKNCP